MSAIDRPGLQTPFRSKTFFPALRPLGYFARVRREAWDVATDKVPGKAVSKRWRSRFLKGVGGRYKAGSVLRLLKGTGEKTFGMGL